MPAGARDHGGVVSVEAWARHGDAGQSRESLGGAAHERTAAGDAAAQYRGAAAGGAHRALQLRNQHVEHGVLEPARHVRPVALRIVARAHGVKHRCLES